MPQTMPQESGSSMELKLINSKGVPEGSIVSIKVATVRRQAPVGSDRPYRFSGLSNGKQQMKVDVFAPVAHARLLIEPCEAHCSVHLDSGPSHVMDKAKLLDEEMFLDFAVSGCLSEGPNSESEANYVQLSRPSSAQSDRSAARRHQVALEAQPYFEQHSLMETMQTMLQGVIKEKPGDPYAYMMRVLENSRNAAAGATQIKQRQRPASALARTGPAPKKLQSALRPSSSRTPGSRSRIESRVSWSTLPVTPLSPGKLSQLPVASSPRSDVSERDPSSIARRDGDQIRTGHRHSSPAALATGVKPIVCDFDMQKLRCVKLLASDLDKTFYPDGMSEAYPSLEAKEEFDKNIIAFKDFTQNGGLAIPVTEHSPAVAQQMFDRSSIAWKVGEHPGIFCNGALVLGMRGAVEYSAPVPTSIMRKLQDWTYEGDGFFAYEGNRYPFAITCLTKDRVLYLPPVERSLESQWIADDWASLKFMKTDTVEPGFDWTTSPVYQVSLLFKSKDDLLEVWHDNKIICIQNALLDNLETRIGKLEVVGCKVKHAVGSRYEINIVIGDVSKGQSMNRLIHAESIKQAIGMVNVSEDVAVVGDAAKDPSMFLEWPQVDDFNGEILKKTKHPAIRILLPDTENVQSSSQTAPPNKVYEIIAAIEKMRVSSARELPPSEQEYILPENISSEQPSSQRQHPQDCPHDYTHAPTANCDQPHDMHTPQTVLSDAVCFTGNATLEHYEGHSPVQPTSENIYIQDFYDDNSIDEANCAKAQNGPPIGMEPKGQYHDRFSEEADLQKPLQPRSGLVPEVSPLANARVTASTQGDLQKLLRSRIAEVVEGNMFQDLLLRSWEMGEEINRNAFSNRENRANLSTKEATSYRSQDLSEFPDQDRLDMRYDQVGPVGVATQRPNSPEIGHRIQASEADARINSPLRSHRILEAEVNQRISSPPMQRCPSVEDDPSHMHTTSPWRYAYSNASESGRDDTGWVPEVESLREETVALRQRTEHLESLMRKFMQLHEGDSVRQ